MLRYYRLLFAIGFLAVESGVLAADHSSVQSSFTLSAGEDDSDTTGEDDSGDEIAPLIVAEDGDVAGTPRRDSSQADRFYEWRF